MEQWEIDLRKQLEGVQPRREEWEDKLEREIKDVKPEKKSSVLSYSIMIAFLIAAFLFVYDIKTGGISNWIKKNKTIVAEPTVPLPPSKSDNGVLRTELEKMKDDNKRQFDDLNRRVKWNNDRISLLATVQQENFLTIRNGGNNFIYFNADWTIDRMPQYLELTPEDKEFLNKYLKK